MILETLQVDPIELERRTSWAIKPQGACKGERCVPLPSQHKDYVDIQLLAARLGMPLIQDSASGLWCLGPETGGQALATVQAPELVLPDMYGNEFSLSSLRGAKVLLVAWASW